MMGGGGRLSVPVPRGPARHRQGHVGVVATGRCSGGGCGRPAWSRVVVRCRAGGVLWSGRGDGAVVGVRPRLVGRRLGPTAVTPGRGCCHATTHRKRAPAARGARPRGAGAVPWVVVPMMGWQVGRVGAGVGGPGGGVGGGPALPPATLGRGCQRERLGGGWRAARGGRTASGRGVRTPPHNPTGPRGRRTRRPGGVCWERSLRVAGLWARGQVANRGWNRSHKCQIVIERFGRCASRSVSISNLDRCAPSTRGRL